MKWPYILIAFLLFSCSTNRSKAYEKKMTELQNMLGGSLNPYILVNFFKEIEGRFPQSLHEVYHTYKRSYFEDIDKIEQHHLKDIFSHQGEWFGYFPIYDSEDSLIVSYFLLSAGIDGKLDNSIDSLGKVHIDDWKQKLDLYNPNEYDNTVSIDTLTPDEEYAIKVNFIDIPPYNAKEEKSGDKDLLIYVHHLVISNNHAN